VTAAFDVDVSKAKRVWLIVRDANSTAIDKAEAAWADAQFVAADGTPTPLESLQTRD
jgi:hypothetical protein